MNKQSNVYTIIYASVMVIVVAAVLAYTALLLKEPQTKNVEIDKMKQILSSVNIASDATNAQELYKKYIVNTYVINADGEKIDGVNAFDVNTANQVKKASSDRLQLTALNRNSFPGTKLCSRKAFRPRLKMEPADTDEKNLMKNNEMNSVDKCRG